MLETAYLALGSNVGNREGHLAVARARIAEIAGVDIVSRTRIEETAAVGLVDQSPFLNQMLAVRTSLRPDALLRELQRIEQSGGRARDLRWGPRTIDIDIVRFGSESSSTKELTLPHPELPNRSFWQRELAELGVSTELTTDVTR